MSYLEEIRFELDDDKSVPHIHGEMEMMFVLSGRVAVMTYPRNFVLESEGLAVFNAFQHHEIYCPSGSHTLSCYISPEIITRAGISSVWCCSTLQPELAEYFNALKEKLAIIFKEYQKGEESHKLFMRGNLFELLDILKTHFEKIDFAAKGSCELRDILFYIGQHYVEKLSLNQVADEFFMSSSFLSRKFQKETGKNFGEYLREIRVQQAAYLLQYTEKSVTDVALSSGFSNTNALIENFKRIYGKTPGEYRKEQLNNSVEQQKFYREQVSYMSLFRYLNHQESHMYYTGPLSEIKSVAVNAAGEGVPLQLSHKNRISVGQAKNIMLETVRKSVKKAKEELGIQYISLYGLLDDEIDVYHLKEGGELYLNFFYVDLIFDFLISEQVIPLVELGITPGPLIKQKMESLYIFSAFQKNLPDDMEGWENLVRELVKHFINRYGEAEVSKWVFSCLPAFLISYKVFAVEQYAGYYESMFRAVREVLPAAKIGGFMLDIELCKVSGDGSLEYLLNYCREHDCMPDELTFQCYHCEYSPADLEQTEKRINVRKKEQTDEPAEISMDPDYLSRGIAYIKSVLKCTVDENIPIVINVWNSSIWQSELGNDTCYKSAWIVKNILENQGKIKALTYSLLTDYSELSLINANTFHGGHGLITYNELPKAGYYAYLLLDEMEGEKIAQGEGYCVTRSKDGEQFQIMLYHYCHYNAETRLRNQLSKEEERTYDRYYSFCTKGMMVFRFLIENIEEGQYELSRRIINRRHCSSYDNWMNMGAPHPLNRMQREYLERVSVPGYQYSVVDVNSDRKLMIAESLDAHEVCLLTLKKIK